MAITLEPLDLGYDPADTASVVREPADTATPSGPTTARAASFRRPPTTATTATSR
jgi:hypothetical protein